MPEYELEAMVVSQMNDVKRHYSMWTNPFQLAVELEISISFGQLGPEQEGAAFVENIVVDPKIGVKARQRFTAYHEIVHHLIRRNNELYSILHDQYQKDKDHTNIIERLCNVGAAEFVIPRGSVFAAIEEEEFSISLVRSLSRVDEISPTAVCVQLASCAKHGCIATICKMASPPNAGRSDLLGQMKTGMVLQVDMAISSPRTKYGIARGSLIPGGHLFYDAYKAVKNDIVSGKAQVPNRHNRSWIEDCEAMRIGNQVFGVFNLEPPPVINQNQLRLF